MTIYAVSGRFQSRDGFSDFSKTIEAPNESVAEERTYATIGSQHGLKRMQIEIDDVEVSSEVVTQ